MLRHISGNRFEADVDDEIQIVARARNNDGVSDARFEYDNSNLTSEVIQGLPGSSFTVKKGRKQFQAVVVFAANASPSARYDLFEVDEVGGLSDLGQSVSSDDGAPLVGFAVEGVMVVAAVGASRRSLRAAPPPPRDREKQVPKKTGKAGGTKASSARRAPPAARQSKSDGHKQDASKRRSTGRNPKGRTGGKRRR